MRVTLSNVEKYDALYVVLEFFHLRNLCLNALKLGELRTDPGRVFQILDPEYAKVFPEISKFGLGTYMFKFSLSTYMLKISQLRKTAKIDEAAVNH